MLAHIGKGDREIMFLSFRFRQWLIPRSPARLRKLVPLMKVIFFYFMAYQ